MSKSESCSNCRFWNRGEEEKRGETNYIAECLRKAPELSSKSYVGSFPDTRSSMWCGQWEEGEYWRGGVKLNERFLIMIDGVTRINHEEMAKYYAEENDS